MKIPFLSRLLEIKEEQIQIERIKATTIEQISIQNKYIIELLRVNFITNYKLAEKSLSKKQFKKLTKTVEKTLT